MTNNNLSAYEYHYIENSMMNHFGFQRKYYFDSSDIVSFIQGTWHFNNNHKFEWDNFKIQSNIEIHAILGRNWLGNIHLLKPHQDEFIYKLTNSKLDFPNKMEFTKDDIFSELIFNLTKEIPKNLFNDFTSSEFVKYVKGLKTNSKLLFKSNSVIDPFFWYNRYEKFIKKEKIIQLSFNAINNSSLIKTPIFQKCLLILEKIRKGKGLPNYLDALAIAQLQEEVDNFKNSNYCDHLPIFYTSSKYLRIAITELIKDDPSILSYTHPQKPERFIPVVRFEDYFIIYPIFNIDKIDNLVIEIIKDIDSIKSTINEVISDDLFLKDTNQIEEKIRALIGTDIELDFFNKVWLHGGYKEFIDAIKNIVDYYDSYDENITRIIEDEKKQLMSEFDNELQYTSLLKKIINALKNIYDETFKIKNIYPIQDHPSLDFGLIRFSLSEDVNKLIDNLIESIFDNLDKNDFEQTQSFNTSVTTLIDLLIFKPEANKNPNEIIAGLTVLWIYSKYDIIVEICQLYEKSNYVNLQANNDSYNSFYSIYFAALVHCDKVSHTLFNELLKKFDDFLVIQDYKYKLTKSFANFQLWITFSTRPIIPEFPNTRQKSFLSKYNYILNTAIRLLEESIKILIELDFQQDSYLRKVYYYLINNYIYYNVKGAKFNKINSSKFKSFVTELEAILHNPNVSQKRFYDSLGWYYYRISFINYLKNDFTKSKKFLNKAKQLNTESFKGPTPNRELANYKQLEESIEKLFFELGEKIKARNKPYNELPGQ